MTRIDTDNIFYWNFGDEFLVVCPGCNSCARVIDFEAESGREVRLSCLHCGHSKVWEKTTGIVQFGSNAARFESGSIAVGADVDWYFHEPLYLQIECGGENLWAYNLEHLRWLRQFVAADLRNRTRSQSDGWSNKSLASRLPKWIKIAANRDRIVKALDKMEERLQSANQ